MIIAFVEYCDIAAVLLVMDYLSTEIDDKLFSSEPTSFSCFSGTVFSVTYFNLNMFTKKI